MASVQCAVIKGDLPLEITWMFEGRPIEPDRADITISGSGKRLKHLTIEAVAARHAGEYTCVASNVAGSVARSSALKVNGTLISHALRFPLKYLNLFHYYFLPIQSEIKNYYVILFIPHLATSIRDSMTCRFFHLLGIEK